MKQTAVSLIAENFNLLSDKDFKSWFLNSLDYLTNLERQQIIDAVDGFPIEHRNLDGAEYYTQTFTEPKND